MASKIVLDGYTLPQGVWVKSDVQEMQKELGVKVDGIWGPKTQAAYDKYTSERGPTARLTYPSLSLPLGVDTAAGVKAVQKQLGTYDTGLWNYDSQNKYDKYLVRRLPQNFEVGKYPILTPKQTYEFDLRAYDWGIGRSDNGDYVVKGYETPEGVNDRESVREWQRILGVAQDGIWGSRTQRAYNELFDMDMQDIQGIPDNTLTTGTNTRQSSQPWQNMIATTGKQGSMPSTAIGNSADQGQIRKLSAQQGESGNSKTYEQQEAIQQLQQERDRQVKRIEALPAWQKTNVLGAGPSAAYAAAMERIAQIDGQIAQINNTLTFESTPKATSSPTQTPSPTPDQTPQPGYITDIEIIDRSKNTPTPGPVSKREFLSDRKSFDPQKAAQDSYMYITGDQLRAIGWKNVDDDTVNGLNWSIRKLDLDTPTKVLCFLASVYHETGSQKKLVESDGTTQYRGGGYIQISGKKRYEEFAAAMEKPEILSQGAECVANNYAWESAVWFWKYGREINRVFDYTSGSAFENVTDKVKPGDMSQDRWDDYYMIKEILFSEYDID